MDRLNKFNALKTHAWLQKSFKKLNANELQIVNDFIALYGDKDKNTFASAAVRLFLDKQKPKHWKEIEELLIACL